MSAQPANTDLLTIEIDGKPTQIRKGAMIIEAADAIGVPIPRFCYHPKLPIAANCRMCLVEVEMGGKPMPKPQPACATPVADGMKVKTRSESALKFQRDVMEFLLINHPLDCPICDQGGECELQDLSLGYGRSVSRFVERKRVVADEDMGPLVATEMTRCIQCTRCVRFTSEIAGTYELGGMSRGDNLQIGTYIGKALETELSGNVIDVCPVGALTNKPFQFKARAWELIARPSIGYHDALGSNLWLHIRRGEVLRTVPRDNEAINECWLSDRDRYSHQGLYAADRLLAPEVKRNGRWQVTTWDDALATAVEMLQGIAGEDLGMLVHPAASNEEGDLLVRMARGLGCAHIDHRLRQLDFSDGAAAEPFALPVAQWSALRAALLVGANLRHDMPLLNHRLHQAVRKGARVHVLNPAHFPFNYRLAGEKVVAPHALVDALLALARAAVAEGAQAPAALAEAIDAAASEAADHDTMAALKSGQAAVVLGEAALTHPHASWLRALARFIAQATGATYAELPLGANAVGLSRLGVLPAAGGLDAQAMLAQPRRAYLLHGIEPPHDFADGARALAALRSARVVACTAFAPAALREVADVLLPIALLPETDATLVNVEGIAQTVPAGATAPGEAREGWKVLRALGGAMQLPGFEFEDLAGLRDGILARPVTPVRTGLAARAPVDGALTRLALWPIYRTDAVLRRAEALNAHPLNPDPAVRVHPQEAQRLGMVDGERVRVGDVELPLAVDPAVPPGTAWIAAAHDLTATLPPYGASITVSKA